MYQQIFIESQPVYIPMIGQRAENYRFNPSTYFIRGWFSRGHFGVLSFYAHLGDLNVCGKIRNLTVYYIDGASGLDRVFFFNTCDDTAVMQLIARLNQSCIDGFVPPLPDLEFVHPAAHALIYSLGKFSGDSDDCFLRADPAAYNLNQKVR